MSKSKSKSKGGKLRLWEMRWAAVLGREDLPGDSFRYAVRTTGIYCRPTCASRRPRRDNVEFFDHWTAAEQAGYRPCQRCRPREITAQSPHQQAVMEACQWLQTAEGAPSLSELARKAGLSPQVFRRSFLRLVGMSPKAFAMEHRAERLRDMLAGSASVTDSFYRAGFNSSGRFYEQASRMLGMEPKKYSQGGRGETIRFAVGECSLGSVLVAATDLGVCALFLGDDPGELTRNLQDRFPQAELEGNDPAFEAWTAGVIGKVASQRSAVSEGIPLDLRGTLFQRRVWQALRDIPPGKTVSYAQLAERIGKPHAVRAVAGACGANPVAVLVPCHRVVRLDGGLGGYRWGVDRKRALLLREQRG